MTETATLTPPSPEVTISPEVHVQLFDGKEFDPALFSAKEQAWLQTGECVGPDSIGKIELDPASLEHLKRNAHYQYINVDSEHGSVIDPDDIIATDQATREPLQGPIDPRSRTILRRLLRTFTEVITQDALGPNDQRTTHFINSSMFVGNYAAADTPHIDSGDIQSIRYLVTIYGPTTEFYNGPLGDENFDADGELITPINREKVRATPCNTGQLVRFMDHGDPHCAPKVEDPTFRIFLVGTVGIPR